MTTLTAHTAEATRCAHRTSPVADDVLLADDALLADTGADAGGVCPSCGEALRLSMLPRRIS